MKKSGILAVILLSAAVGTTARGNMISNPSFDTGPGAGWGNWDNTNFDTWDPRTGTGHAAFYGDNESNDGGVFQAGIPGSPGVNYQFSVYGSFQSSWDASAKFGLEFYLADDGTEISEVKVPFDNGAVLGDGYFLYSMTAVAPVGTVYVRPVFQFDTVLSTGDNRAATFDDADLEALPEPASLGMMMIIGAGALLSRRRMT